MLLLDIANDKLRDFFKKKWPIVHQRLKGTLQRREWSDTADDAKLLREVCKLKFFRHDSETLFSSGNTKKWDFSILKTILQNSALGFIDTQSAESAALKTLSYYRNTYYAHSPDSRAISKTEFGDMWMQIRPALEVFGATQKDFMFTETLWYVKLDKSRVCRTGVIQNFHFSAKALTSWQARVAEQGKKDREIKELTCLRFNIHRKAKKIR